MTGTRCHGACASASGARGRRATLAGLAAAGIGLAVLVPAVPAVAAPGPSSAPEYWFDAWQIPALWASGARGQGVTIAEIDTGVNADLPELAGRIVPGTDLGEGGNGEVDREVSAFGHGTAMASIMVARPGLLDITGVAQGAELMPIAVPLDGTTDASPDDRLAEAIRYAAGHGAKVISMSVGGVRTPRDTDEPCPAAEQDAIYYALSKGAVLLAAAGNSGTTGDGVEQPGVCLGVVAVGAVDQAGQVAPFSSRHRYVTLTAPGVQVASLSRVPGSAYVGQGTSQATAIASAVTALVWSKYPALTGRQVVARVLATLDQRRRTPSPAYGYGIIDAHRAVTAAVPADAPNPVYSAVAPFLARYQALSAAPTAPKPAVRPAAKPAPNAAATPGPGAPTAPGGGFAVGAGPSERGAAVPAGLAIAGLGLLALVGLAVTGLLRHRRRPDPVTATPTAPEVPPAAGPGLQWREIAAPPDRPGTTE